MTRVLAAYLGSSLLSTLANAIAAVALPLIVLQSTGSVLGTGVVAAATAVPAVVAGILMGGLIDRIDRRTASVVADLISAASIAALPLIDLVTDLGIGWFVLLGVLGSFGDVPGLTAREALLPAIVRHSGVGTERVLGLREALGAVALLLGPVAAGVLVPLLPGSAVLWITAALSAAAALLTLAIPRAAGRIDAGQAAHPTTARGIGAGLRLLAADGFLRTTTIIGLLSVLVVGGLQGLVLPLHLTALGIAGALGFVLAAIAAGMLVGAAVYASAGARGDRRSWLVAGLLITGVGTALVCALPDLWLLLVGAALLGAGSSALGGVLGVLTIERIPDALRGRVLSAQNAGMTLAAPAGIMLAALLGEAAGAAVAALGLLVVCLLAVAGALVAPSLRTLERSSTEEAAHAQQ